METEKAKTLLFIVNPGSGSNNTNFRAEIESFFNESAHSIHFFELGKDTAQQEIKSRIKELEPTAVIAVGGDGTIKLVAECLLGSEIPLGIVPAGSANGMARELGIDIKLKPALNIICEGSTRAVSAIKVNEQICIHLSDIGINAWIVKKFGTGKTRGWWGYAKAGWQVIRRPPQMQVSIKSKEEEIHRQAVMVVVANATKYGTGVVINPVGELGDDVFEIVVIKKISFAEILKMRLTHRPFDPAKTEVFQTGSVKIKSRRSMHFQVDGEYLGKTTTVYAEIMPRILKVLVPAAKNPA